jgi:hypothetical protein
MMMKQVRTDRTPLNIIFPLRSDTKMNTTEAMPELNRKASAAMVALRFLVSFER